MKSIDTAAMPIRTVNDLKRAADQLVKEGKGDWPVMHMHDDYGLYLRIHMYRVFPGNAPYEGLELRSDFIDAPEGEHILIQLGDVNTDED